MVRFPNAKINLGLHVIARRQDGYHDLETIFYPVEWCDIIEIIKSEDDFSFSGSGLPVPGEKESNLCIRAYKLLSEEYHLPSVKIHQHKMIPMGAGLGGGSSDAAFTLEMLNALCNLNLEKSSLIKYAAQLGSDAPFFISNNPVIATGRGDIMAPLKLNLAGYYLIILKPVIHISTAEAFAGIEPNEPTRSVSEIIMEPIERWKELLVNDFEKTVFERHPEIKKLKDLLYHSGAIYASLSGSGSAVYGIFKEKTAMVDLPAEVIKWEGVLK